MKPLSRALRHLLLLAFMGCSPKPTELSIPDPEAPPVPSGCLNIGVLLPLRFTGKAGPMGDNVEARLDRELGGEGVDKLSIRFRPPAGVELGPGSYALGMGANSRFSTCNECVSVLEDWIGVNVAHLNFATEGTLQLEDVNLQSGEYRGSLKNVVLRSLLPSPDDGWDGVDPNIERCLFISEARFDTFASQRPSCATSEDCVNHARQVCDPNTARCVLNQCYEDDPKCSAGSVCELQSEAYETGACYTPCTPFTENVCPSGQECVSVSYDGSRGVCRKTGLGTLGQKGCVATTLATGCVPGAVCQAIAPLWPKEQYCTETCNYFSSTPGCSRGVCRLIVYGREERLRYCYGARCHVGGTCTEVENVDAAAIGEKCSGPVNSPCAAEDGARARGICDYSTCQQVCALSAPSCPLGTTCTQYVTADTQNTVVPGIGICK
ncbi:MAG: hypothetical protein SFV15_22830 [Polyangiaceae bacterium]|nr:hypothetical protein [Polyangiaceae bacterium]